MARKVIEQPKQNPLTGPAMLIALMVFTALVIAAWPILPTIATITLWSALATGIVFAVLFLARFGIGLRNDWLEGNTLRPVDELGNYEVRVTRKGLIQPVPINSPQFAKVTHYHGGAMERASALPELPYSVQELPALALPDVVELSSLTVNWKPSVKEILLALGPGGERLVVRAQDLCHVALAGFTGGGKSNLMRLLLAQLLQAGAQVVLADPHYTPFDAKTGEDWRPIEARLKMSPAVSIERIAWLLEQVVDELDRRLKIRNSGKDWGLPFFLAIDELPVIAAALPDIAPQAIARIVREGRKVDLLLITSAQDWLVKTIGGDSSAIRTNFRTAFYVGGDPTTGKALLALPNGKEGSKILNDTPLGKGIALLRSTATPTAQAVRVPLVSNETLARMLYLPRPASQSQQEEASRGNTRSSEYQDDIKSGTVINGQYRTLPEAKSVNELKTDTRLPKKGTRLYDALLAYQAGANSAEKLAKAMNCAKSTAHSYMRELEQRGLIPGPNERRTNGAIS